MKSYALPVASVIIIILLLCNATFIFVYIQDVLRSPKEKSYASIQVGLGGDGGAEVSLSRSGVRVDSHGGAVATVQMHIFEPELTGYGIETPTWTPTPTPPIVAIRIKPDGRYDSGSDLDIIHVDSDIGQALSIIADLVAPTATPTPTHTPEPALFTLSGASRYRLRSCPRHDCSIEGHVYPGQNSVILGIDPSGYWFYIAEDHGRELWVAGESAIIIGRKESIPVIQTDSKQGTVPGDIPAVAQSNKPVFQTPAPAKEEQTPVPVANVFPFEITSQETFTSDKPPRVLAWMHTREGEPVGGVSFQVFHNGIRMDADEGAMTTSVPERHISWPRPFGDNRERPYNLKMEFKGVPPGGTWEIQPFYQGLALGVGVEAGVRTMFTIDDGEQGIEMYVKYQKK